eukprot:526510_1
MSKQVQRYSSHIRPHPDDLKKKKKIKHKSETATTPFTDQEMKSHQFAEKERAIRQSWDKGDEVEIFSNTHQEWYLGEVVDIIKDDEGEWLNCVWARANGEAMSKQVQRFSTDVRPVQDDSSSNDTSDENDDTNGDNKKVLNTNKTTLTPADKIKVLAQKIAQRKTNFRRRAPPFSRTLRPSTFTYPATSSARRARKLLDLEETLEKNQHVVDAMPKPGKQSNIKRIEIENYKPQQVREFIRGLGSAYERYANKFRNVSGRQLIKFTEISLQKFGITPKLHRNKILLEIHRNAPTNNKYSTIFIHDVDVLNWNSSKVQEWLNKTQVTSIYSHKFFNHGIDGMLLFELDSKDLNTIGIKKIHQQRILDIIAKFAKAQFPSNDDDQKDEEQKNGLELDKQPNVGKKKRGSIAHIPAIPNGDSESNEKLLNIQNNDAIIYTMGELLLELGKMFKVGRVQDLTTRLEQQLAELQAHSAHPQMLKRGSLNLTKIDTNTDVNDEHQSLTAKMQDRIDTSPTGVSDAWIKTQNQAKGHKRRSSLPYINANQLNDDDEDDDEDISDIE